MEEGGEGGGEGGGGKIATRNLIFPRSLQLSRPSVTDSEGGGVTLLLHVFKVRQIH